MLAGLDAIEATLQLDGRADAAGFEDLFFLREDALRREIGAELAGRLHTGRSRNDLEATIFRLQLRARMVGTMAMVAELAATVLRIARHEAATPILAYTHGQPAQPTTYGHYLAAFAEVLIRDLARLERALDDLDASPMGAAAITTTGFPISRERVAELLGFARVQENSYGCIAAVDQLAAAYSALRILFLNIGRLTQDLAFWTSFEVGQARAPDGFVQVSSIMPQKRNPLAIEHLRTMGLPRRRPLRDGAGRAAQHAVRRHGGCRGADAGCRPRGLRHGRTRAASARGFPGRDDHRYRPGARQHGRFLRNHDGVRRQPGEAGRHRLP
jgi:argininosuccinate lyase